MAARSRKRPRTGTLSGSGGWGWGRGRVSTYTAKIIISVICRTIGTVIRHYAVSRIMTTTTGISVMAAKSIIYRYTGRGSRGSGSRGNANIVTDFKA